MSSQITGRSQNEFVQVHDSAFGISKSHRKTRCPSKPSSLSLLSQSQKGILTIFFLFNALTHPLAPWTRCFSSRISLSRSVMHRSLNVAVVYAMTSHVIHRLQFLRVSGSTSMKKGYAVLNHRSPSYRKSTTGTSSRDCLGRNFISSLILRTCGLTRGLRLDSSRYGPM